MTHRFQYMLRACSFVLIMAFGASCVGGCSSDSSSGAQSLQGRWTITKKPEWVDRNYLAHNSNEFQFLPGGVCQWGRATGRCEVKEGVLVTSFGMQKATPGFTGSFSFTVAGDTLTLKNLAEDQPVVLVRSK